MARVTGKVGPDGHSAVPEGYEPIEDAKLNEQMEDELHELWKASGIEEDGDKARFKLEVIFHDDRSMHQAYLGTIVAWASLGAHAHGGGDESVYFCPAILGHGRQCFTPIDMRLVQGDVAVCPDCKTATKPKDLIGQVTARLRTQQWVELLTRMFFRLGSDADIRIGHFHGDLRQAAEANLRENKHGEVLDRMYNDRAWVIYPLKEIMKDVHSGATIESRIRALLSA